ncbi:hypothetical protein TcCL_ESM07367 [Trypanosoma cruzi]|nr:hypothetical protein TcCL_ESM07367 [Trypanosoma cruzi]
MCRRLCDCRVEGEAWREVRGCSGQESRWVSCRGGHCPPSLALLLSAHTLSLSAGLYSTPPARSEAADATTATSATGREHTCCCVPRGQSVWHSGVPTTPSRSPHTTPGTGRGVFASWRTLRLSPSSFQVDGRLFLLFFPPRRMAAR